MTQLPYGPPTKPPTPLTPEGIKAIRDRLVLVSDTRGYGDEMAPALKNTVETMITQDIPALLAYYNSVQDCEACTSIHKVHHVKQETRAQSLQAMRDPYAEPTRLLPGVNDEAGF